MMKNGKEREEQQRLGDVGGGGVGPVRQIDKLCLKADRIINRKREAHVIVKEKYLELGIWCKPKGAKR